MKNFVKVTWSYCNRVTRTRGNLYGFFPKSYIPAVQIWSRWPIHSWRYGNFSRSWTRIDDIPITWEGVVNGLLLGTCISCLNLITVGYQLLEIWRFIRVTWLIVLMSVAPKEECPMDFSPSSVPASKMWWL